MISLRPLRDLRGRRLPLGGSGASRGSHLPGELDPEAPIRAPYYVQHTPRNLFYRVRVEIPLDIEASIRDLKRLAQLGT